MAHRFNSYCKLAVLVGGADELFLADRFEATVHGVRTDVPHTVVPDLNLVQMTTDPRSFPAIIAAIQGK